MNTIELPPASISVDEFGNKVRDIHAGLEHGPAKMRHIKQLERAYYQIDSLHPINLDDRDAEQMVSTLDKAAEVCEVALLNPKALQPKQEAVQTLLGGLLIEKATLGVTLSTQTDKELVQLGEDMQYAKAVFGRTKSAKSNNPKVKYQHHDIGNVFGGLSASATSVYIDSLLLDRADIDPARRTHAQTALRKRIGGIATSAIGHMRVMSDVLHTSTGELGNERGRFMEMTAFAQKALLWYYNKNPSEGYVRFSVQREDRPRTDTVPRRGFDLLTRQQDQYRPVQVKIGGASGHYHESIALWRPVRPDDVMEATGLVVDTFETVIDPRADFLDVKRAQNLIETQFQQTKAKISLTTR